MKTVVILVSAIGALTTALAFSGGFLQAPEKSLADQPKKESIHASYIGYTTFDNLIGNSTAIVAGETLGIKAVDDEGNIPTTDFDFRIDNVIQGNLKAGDIITIRQTGAETAEKIAELDDNPLLRKGETVLGFLRYAEEHGVYVFVGGPQGRFEIQNGLVNSMDKVVPEAAWVPIKADNQTVAEFAKVVQSEARS